MYFNQRTGALLTFCVIIFCNTGQKIPGYVAALWGIYSLKKIGGQFITGTLFGTFFIKFFIYVCVNVIFYTNKVLSDNFSCN